MNKPKSNYIYLVNYTYWYADGKGYGSGQIEVSTSFKMENGYSEARDYIKSEIQNEEWIVYDIEKVMLDNWKFLYKLKRK